MKIILKDICFAYDTEPVLSHFNLEINKGETVVLKGPNGCGKSTILKILNGLLFFDCGEYHFFNKEISEKSLKDSSFSKSFHQKIGYVFQNTDVQLFCSNVYDEVAFGARQMGLDEKEVEKRVDDMMKLLEIKKLSDRAPYHLSFGEKKRVAIASVLITNPDVLIFDEPLNGLDEKMQQWVVDFIIQMKKVDKTILVVTHNNELTEKIADRVVSMD